MIIIDDANDNCENDQSPSESELETRIKQISQFFDFVAPDGKIAIQTFDENKDRKAAGIRRTDLHRVFPSVTTEHFDEIFALNSAGAACCCTINETDGKGRRNENVTRIRFVFCDLDQGGVEKLQRIMADHSRPPHMIIESSPGKYHVYWKVDDSVKLEHFTPIQRALAENYGGDPAVKDLARVMRIPGLYHNKGAPFLTRIVEIHEDMPPYSSNDFVKELAQFPSAKQAQSPDLSDGHTGVPEGKRNTTLFRRSCQLKQQGMPREEAEPIILAEVATYQPPLSKAEAIQCLDSAWRYRDEHEEIIAELNSELAKILVGGSCYIMQETKDETTGQVKHIDLFRPDDMRTWYSHRTITTKAGDHDKDINIVDYWLRHPKHRRYRKIVFAPGQTLPDDVYNLYRGFGVKPSANGNCDLFLKHIEGNIADGNPEIYRYILDWMADAVQNPTQRPGVALLLQGDQGVGKSVFGDQFGKLFGQHYVQITSSRELTGIFNAHLEGKLLVFYDEANCLGDRQATAKLKALITERSLPIERKGRDLLYVDNYIRLILASNNNVVIPAALDERRFFAIQVGNKHQGDHPYFKAIFEEMDNGGREHLLHLLLTRDLSVADLYNFPKTKALLENKLGSMEPVFKWWYEEWLMRPADQWCDVVGKETLYQGYLDYCTNTGERHPLGKNIFGKTIKVLVPGVKDVRRTTRQYGSTLPQKTADASRERQYQLRSQQECRQFFEALIKQPIDWDADQ